MAVAKTPHIFSSLILKGPDISYILLYGSLGVGSNPEELG